MVRHLLLQIVSSVGRQKLSVAPVHECAESDDAQSSDSDDKNQVENIGSDIVFHDREFLS